MNHLDLVKLTALMEHTSGRTDVMIGLIDGPILMQHPDLTGEHVRELPGEVPGTCTQAKDPACRHGTFVAGILSARRTSPAPAICPGCTLLVRPIFMATLSEGEQTPQATPDALATAIIDCVRAGARLLNLSLGLAQPSSTGLRALEEALDYAAKRNVLVLVAAGNQGTIGSSPLTRHPCVVPVIAYDLQGRPMSLSNLGSSIGRRGVGAPGDHVTSLGTEGEPLTLGGTSVAVPFVTGTSALLWSAFPAATAAEVRLAINTGAAAQRRKSIVPPLLDAWAAYQVLLTIYEGGESYA